VANKQHICPSSVAYNTARTFLKIVQQQKKGKRKKKELRRKALPEWTPTTLHQPQETKASLQ
jgi:hypothetical protein